MIWKRTFIVIILLAVSSLSQAASAENSKKELLSEFRGSFIKYHYALVELAKNSEQGKKLLTEFHKLKTDWEELSPDLKSDEPALFSKIQVRINFLKFWNYAICYPVGDETALLDLGFTRRDMLNAFELASKEYMKHIEENLKLSEGKIKVPNDTDEPDGVFWAEVGGIAFNELKELINNELYNKIEHEKI